MLLTKANVKALIKLKPKQGTPLDSSSGVHQDHGPCFYGVAQGKFPEQDSSVQIGWTPDNLVDLL